MQAAAEPAKREKKGKIHEKPVAPPVMSPKVDTALHTNGKVMANLRDVTLDTVLAAFADGATAEEIVQQYPSLQLADVYSVIGYYLRHTTEVDMYLQQRHQQRKTVRQQNEARFDPHGIRERLLARRASRGQ